jgi:hypothetical protein
MIQSQKVVTAGAAFLSAALAVYFLDTLGEN